MRVSVVSRVHGEDEAGVEVDDGSEDDKGGPLFVTVQSSRRKFMAAGAKPGCREANKALKPSGLGLPVGRQPRGAATSVPRTISRSGSSARRIKLVLVATWSSGISGGGLRMLSGPGRPRRRSQTSVRKN